MDNAKQQATEFLSQLFEPIVKTIAVKTYFSYYGAMKNEKMFALYKEDKLYIRATKNTIQKIQNIEGSYLLQDPDKFATSKHYFIPETLYHTTFFHQLTRQVVKDLYAEIGEQENRSKRLIRYLPNMNANIEKLLRKVEIYTQADLKRKGAIWAFVELLKRDINVNEMLLYKLHAAVNHKFVGFVSEEEKMRLLMHTDFSLKNAGQRMLYQNRYKVLLNLIK